jgi:hypothetical protein
MPAKTLIARIELEGAQAIGRELAALGKQGERAFEDMRKAARRVDFTPVRRAMEDYRAQVANAEAAGRKFGQSINTLAGDIAALPRNLRNLAIGIGGVVTALGFLAKGSVETASEIKDTADAFDVSTKELQGWQGAAGQFGIDQEKFKRGIGKLVGQMDDATKAETANKKAMNDLTESYVRGDIGAGEYSKQIGELTKKQNESTDALTRFGIKLDPKAGVGRNL